MVIGVSGMSGVGKNYFSNKLCEQMEDTVHIDIDLIGHKVLEEKDIIYELEKYFGSNIISNGRVDRKSLAEIVFNNREKYNKLAEVTWDKMKVEIDKILCSNHKNYILNWILLPQSHYFNMCDVKYLIVADNDIRIRDVISRDKITKNQLKVRDKNSIEYDENKFDFVVKGVRK